MVEADIQNEIDRLLSAEVAELEVAAAAQSLNLFELIHALDASALVQRQDLSVRLLRIASRYSTKDLLKGALTNIDVTRVEASPIINESSAGQFDRDHPVCTTEQFIGQLRKRGEGYSHIHRCLDGDADGAVRLISRDVDLALGLEEIGCTLVLMGEFERAMGFIDARSTDEYRRSQVRFVILLEKCRCRHPGFLHEIARTELHGGSKINVILALLGRLPWAGYPFPDW